MWGKISFIWGALKWLWHRLRISLWHRKLKYYWRFSNKEVIIIHPIYEYPEGKPLPDDYMRIDDFEAIKIVEGVLRKLNIRYTIDNHSREKPRDKDIVLVCGPKGNEMSKYVNELPQMKIAWRKDSDDTQSGYYYDKELNSRIGGAGTEQEEGDFAIVGRVYEKDFNRKWFLLWGKRGVGTTGGAKYTCSKKQLTKLKKAVRKDDYQVFVKVPYEEKRNIGEPYAAGAFHKIRT